MYLQQPAPFRDMQPQKPALCLDILLQQPLLQLHVEQQPAPCEDMQLRQPTLCLDMQRQQSTVQSDIQLQQPAVVEYKDSSVAEVGQILFL